MNIDIGRLMKHITKQHRSYLEDNTISGHDLDLAFKRHITGECFPDCIGCKIDADAIRFVVLEERGVKVLV